MNVLFLTLLDFESIEENNIYTDLLREFVKNGHDVYSISPVERRKGVKTHVVKESHSTILRLQIGNVQKTNIIEKGISTVMIEPSFTNSIKEYFSDVVFDLVLYSTPPITFCSAIEYVRRRDNAKTYLLLKDIFPQNAVDIGLMSKEGVKGLLFKHFRKKEKKLYQISDRIGCMSQANVDYVIKHNPGVDRKKVEICPNSINIVDKSINSDERIYLRSKYEIPLDKTVFVYGGNLGKPQAIPFLIECIERCSDIDDAYFLIIGDGTEYGVLKEFVIQSNNKQVKLMKRIPKEDYDSVVAACDVGLIFLDYRFTIPNFPSRLLGYMQARIPVLAATDSNTDIGTTIVEGGFGWWCKSDNSAAFSVLIRNVLRDVSNLSMYGNRAYEYLSNHFDSKQSYRIIIASIGENKLG